MSDGRKSIISVTDMAKLVGLSRQRFNQLVKQGLFPSADRDEQSARPFYNSEKQQQCLLVRQTHTGINGKPILFYSRRRDSGTKRASATPSAPKADTTILQQLAELGVNVTMKEVETASATLFPAGTISVAHETVLKGLFLHFRRKNKADSDGR
jgi:predicted DNA-binding transcriptional regulator AlpA